jgi:N-acetylmuramoyl-L-alanine amidase
VIDPGHGGHDPGALNPSLHVKEKDLCLKVAKKLAALLKKNDFKVILTRSDDRFLSLEERSALSRKKKADLFLSIHFNASTNPDANGIETFAYTLLNHPSTGRTELADADRIYQRANRQDSANFLFAFALQDELLRRTAARDRGVKRSRFVVIENLNCPGALVELGFVSHQETAEKLLKTGHVDQLASAIATAIERYATYTQSQ